MTGSVVTVGRTILFRTETGDRAIEADGRTSKHGDGH
jgi:hypothetical protein